MELMAFTWLEICQDNGWDDVWLVNFVCFLFKKKKRIFTRVNAYLSKNGLPTAVVFVEEMIRLDVELAGVLIFGSCPLLPQNDRTVRDPLLLPLFLRCFIHFLWIKPGWTKGIIYGNDSKVKVILLKRDVFKIYNLLEILTWNVDNK